MHWPGKANETTMVGHLCKSYDKIYVSFFATYTCDLSYSMFFFPKDTAIFFSYVRSADVWEENGHILGKKTDRKY